MQSSSTAPTVVHSRQPTWSGLVELCSAVKSAEEHTTKKIRRFPAADLVARDLSPEARCLEQRGVIVKVGDAKDFPVGYAFTDKGRAYAAKVVEYASQQFGEFFPEQQPSA